MGRKYAPTEPDTTDTTTESAATERDSPLVSTETTGATIAATKTIRGETANTLSNTLTIIGHDSPSSFEITVDGDIELLEEDCAANTTIVSGSTVEGTIEDGTIRFRFTGDLTDVTFVDRRITGLSPAAVPNVHVDYPAPEQSRT